ncbi:hypothetical protein UA75_27105 [Actinoalloteichus sp. GBA129-24]|nr:hypothetical protein UA75_27105 [Actinoalloteichus sp. GBA129-24]
MRPVRTLCRHRRHGQGVDGIHAGGGLVTRRWTPRLRMPDHPWCFARWSAFERFGKAPPRATRIDFPGAGRPLGRPADTSPQVSARCRAVNTPRQSRRPCRICPPCPHPVAYPPRGSRLFARPRVSGSARSPLDAQASLFGAQTALLGGGRDRAGAGRRLRRGRAAGGRMRRTRANSPAGRHHGEKEDSTPPRRDACDGAEVPQGTTRSSAAVTAADQLLTGRSAAPAVPASRRLAGRLVPRRAPAARLPHTSWITP